MVTRNDILMYLTHNEGMTVVAERIIKTLISKIYKKTRSNDSKFDLLNLGLHRFWLK